MPFRATARRTFTRTAAGRSVTEQQPAAPREPVEGRITAIQPQERRGGRRFNVFVEGAFAFALADDIAARLRVGEQLSLPAADALLEQDDLRIAVETAVSFLGPRPRSEREIRQRLARRATPPGVVDAALVKLREHGLVDDEAFARYWVEQRQTFRPRGARLLKAELRQKGIDVEVADGAVGVTEETADDDAYRSAVKKARQLSGLDERTFKTRLGQFLARRGFGWDVIQPAAQRLWREQSDA